MDNFQYMRRDSQFPTVIQPNVKKIIAFKALKLLVIYGIILLGFYILKNYLSLDNLSIVFEFFDIKVNTTAIFNYLLVVMISLFIIFILLNYLKAKTARTEFFNDHLNVIQPSLFFFTNNLEIKYTDIIRMSYNFDGLFNTLLHTGTISLEVSSLNAKIVHLNYVENVENVAERLQGMINMSKQLSQARFDQRYRIDDIFDKYEGGI